MAGPSNAKHVYDDLVRLGLSPGAAAGVVGNLVQESNVNPSAIGDNGTSGGIAQWHNSRWDALKKWAALQRTNWQLLSTQEGFLVHELRQMGLWDKLKKTDSPDYAARLVMTQFERPKDQSASAIAGRQSIARQILAKNGDYTSANTSKGGGGVGITGAAQVAGDQIVGGVSSVIVDPVVAGLQSASETLIKGAQPLVVKGLFVALAVSLIGAGLYKAIGANRLVSAVA